MRKIMHSMFFTLPCMSRYAIVLQLYSSTDQCLRILSIICILIEVTWKAIWANFTHNGFFIVYKTKHTLLSDHGVC